MNAIFAVAAQHPWVKNTPPVLQIIDLSKYGMGMTGSMVSFNIELDPAGDAVEWNELNKDDPYIVVWLEEGSINKCCGVPRFEVGYGPVHIARDLSHDDVSNALVEVLHSMRV